MRFIEIADILDKIQYQMSNGEYVKFKFLFDENLAYLQIRANLEDNETGVKSLQSGRKWILSQHMTKTEIVRTAWKAVQAFEFHEMEERFKYKGKAIFNGHIDVDELANVAERVDVRTPVV
jgi:hypothetical protein